MATLVHDTLCATLSGLSKVYRACGYRVGWAVFSGRHSTRPPSTCTRSSCCPRCACAATFTAQWAVQTALGGYQSIRELVAPGGRLHESRARDHRRRRGAAATSRLAPPAGRMYAFVGVRPAGAAGLRRPAVRARSARAEARAGRPRASSFNVPYRNHFRITNLPDAAHAARGVRAHRGAARWLRGECGRRKATGSEGREGQQGHINDFIILSYLIVIS